MKLIVGLGNPGSEYYNTRHNMGFIILDYYCDKNKLSFCHEKFGGIYAESVISNEKVIFLKPQNFINLSGEVIAKYVDYFKIDVGSILIIHDDLDLELGKFKLRELGGTAGHNGLKNIELMLNTNKYKRIKIGISNNHDIDKKDYVLGKFDSDSMVIVDKISKVVSLIIDDYFSLSFSNLMNKWNNSL